MFFSGGTVHRGGPCESGAVRIFLCKNGHGKKAESVDRRRSDVGGARQMRADKATGKYLDNYHE